MGEHVGGERGLKKSRYWRGGGLFEEGEYLLGIRITWGRERGGGGGEDFTGRFFTGGEVGGRGAGGGRTEKLKGGEVKESLLVFKDSFVKLIFCNRFRSCDAHGWIRFGMGGCAFGTPEDDLPLFVMFINEMVYHTRSLQAEWSIMCGPVAFRSGPVDIFSQDVWESLGFGCGDHALEYVAVQVVCF